MTETKLKRNNDPSMFLRSLYGKASRRKRRLFVCACVRRIWLLLQDETSRKAVEVAERFADGLADSSERKAVRKAASGAPPLRSRRNPEPAEWCAAQAAVMSAAEPVRDVEAARWAARAAGRTKGKPFPHERTAQSELARDIFGNCNRQVAVASGWLTPPLVQLAQAIYDYRSLPEGILDNARLAVLADALEEAGCTDEDILSHCRGPGPHARGCWVVDLVLKKK